MTDVSAMILAGGLSRRMGGGDKALRQLAGRPMISRVIARLGPQVARLAINANGDPSRFAELGLPVLADEASNYPGPLAGILVAMRWALREPTRNTSVLTVPVDTPFLPMDLVERLEAARAENDGSIILAGSRGSIHQVVGLWPLEQAADLERFVAGGGRKVLDWVLRHHHTVVPFSDLIVGGQHIDPFFNINTPDDLSRAEALIEAG